MPQPRTRSSPSSPLALSRHVGRSSRRVCVDQMGAHALAVVQLSPKSPSSLQITTYGSPGHRPTHGDERLAVLFITCSRRACWAEVHWTQLAYGARTPPVRFVSGHASPPANSGEEWQLLDCALHAYGKVGVALYDTLGKDAVGEHTYVIRL